MTIAPYRSIPNGSPVGRIIHKTTRIEMPSPNSPWEREILDAMKDGCVTFAWDGGEILTVQAPAGQLDDMRIAWEWVGPKLRELEAKRGHPRSVCFRLTSGEFRGLKFPDPNPTAL